MSLQLIIGNSGSGKSRYLYDRIIEESQTAEGRARHYLVIVPEQFTMQTQRELVLLHPARGIMNIDVLSFRRLAHRVFEEVGADRRTVLTETGKNLMLRKVAIREREKLKVLGGRMNRPGYVSEVKSVLSELMQYEVTDFDLQEMERFAAKRPLLAAKLADIRCLYRAFTEYERERFLKPEELLDVLIHVAGQSRLLEQSVLAFDGFAGFTPSQVRVLEKLLSCCPKVYLTVTLDAREPVFGNHREHELFAPSRKLIRQACDAAKQAGSRLEEPVVLGGDVRPRFAQCPALDHLEQNLFRARRAVFDGRPEGISLHVSPSPASEVHFAARTISRLVREEGYRYREIAVITGDLSSYNNYVKKIFPQYGIPAFLDETRRILLNPCMEFVRGALELVQRDFSYESVFRCLRTGMVGLTDEGLSAEGCPAGTVPAEGCPAGMVSVAGCPAGIVSVDNCPDGMILAEGRPDEIPSAEGSRNGTLPAERWPEEMLSAENNPDKMQISDAQSDAQPDAGAVFPAWAWTTPEDRLDRLENYVLATGIRGRKGWEREWTYRPGRMPEEELNRCNLCRERVMEKLGAFHRAMAKKGRTLREYAEALYGLLEDCGVQQQLKDRELLLLSAGAREEAAEYAQIYVILIGLLDEMVDLLGDETMDVQEFSEILEAGLSEAKVGVIPPGTDQVQVGDIRRSRLSGVKALFFLGLNDGWVPPRGDGGGIVSDMERELLKETGVELAPSARENSYIQRFYLYQNLTKPSRKLFLSWSLGSSDGTVMRPSYLVSVVRRMFPELPVTEEQEAGTSLEQVTSKENGMLFLTRGLQDLRNGSADRGWRELYLLYRSDPDYRGRVAHLVSAAFAHGGHEHLTYHTSKELYGEVMRNSVTRLEQFAACSFAHFARYGLRLEERELYGIKPADLGLLFHRAMELFSKKLLSQQRDWTELTEAEEYAWMEQCVDEAAEASGTQAFSQSAREAYTLHRVKRILCRSVWALHEQLAAGVFRPSGFEVSFDDGPGELEAVNVRLGENGRMRLSGRIDRIDTAKDDSTVYVKIVDYKSGMTQFDPVSLYYGLQLQLVVYLNAAMEIERGVNPDREVVPAGIFYYHLQDPVLEREAGMDNAQAREKLLKKLRPDGILNSDERILRMLDAEIEGESLVIPAGLKKDGKPKAASRIVSTEQFGQLSRFVTRKMARMGSAMLGGDIAVKPAVTGNSSACDYCEYADVCGFDRKLPGMCENRLKALGREEVWEKIAEEDGARSSAESGTGGIAESRDSEMRKRVEGGGQNGR